MFNLSLHKIPIPNKLPPTIDYSSCDSKSTQNLTIPIESAQNLMIPTYTIDTKTKISSIGDDYIDKKIKEMFEQLSYRPIYQHKCINCGGQVELDPNKGVFKCPFCDSVYLVGTERINDRG